MTAAEALRRYHGAETRLREVEAQIDAIEQWGRDRVERLKRYPWERDNVPPRPLGDLVALLIERDRLQAESFRVFAAAREGSP